MATETMMMNVSDYLSLFNTNPACAGVGVTDVGGEQERQIALAIYILVAMFIVVTSAWYFYMRQYRRRLKIRSLNPIVMGSLGSAICILVRASFNYVGRENFPCASNLALMYLFFILNMIPEFVLVSMFLLKQKHRSQLTAVALFAELKHQDPLAESIGTPGKNNKAANQHLSVATRSTHASSVSGTSAADEIQTVHYSQPSHLSWLKGLWNHLLTLFDSAQFITGSDVKLHEEWKFREEANRTITPFRELSYDFLCTMLVSYTLWIGLGARLTIVPAYQPSNKCSGCGMFAEDIPILLACLAVPVIYQILVVLRSFKVLDPLSYRRDMIVTIVISSLAWVGYILAVVDPGDLMKTQKIDWFLFESIAALLLHMHRCILQLYRVSRFHRLGEQQIKLIDILQDPRAAILFEKYLMGELASENLLFWREGIKYKYNFDRNKDFDQSQMVAKILFRTFVTKHANMPINISGELREQLENRFRSGYLGKNVFDEALIEVYKMMQNGPFYRFIRSAPFVEYAKNKADFSTLASNQNGLSFNPLSIVPASEKEEVEAAARRQHESTVVSNNHHHSMMSSSSSSSNANKQRRLFDIGDYVHNM